MDNNYFRNMRSGSLRLKGYDYSRQGIYFITISTYNNQYLFGEIISEEMKLNEAGEMIKHWWLELPNKFNIELKEFQIMPNHFHGLIKILDNYEYVYLHKEGTDKIVDTKLSAIVQWFKAMSTNEYIRNVKNKNWKPFDRKVWHRNYYESIVRTKEGYNKVSKYIVNNPKKWNKDRLWII